MAEATETALLAAIYAAPADDAPRMVYADYLMECGDKRGEVIALQCGKRELARAHALLAKHRGKWLGPLAAAIDPEQTFTFERGFVATASLAANAPVELDDHPAWATLRRVELPKLAKRRGRLLAHLKRLGVQAAFPRSVRNATTVLEDLEYTATKGENRFWRGHRGLANLGAGVDQKLVERVMRIILPWSATGPCNHLPAEYVPLAWRTLAKVETPEATFLRTYLGHDDGARLRDACEWLYEFRMNEPRNKHRLPELVTNEEAVIAAIATVARHGIAAERLLAVPAYVGGDAAVAAIAPIVKRALAKRGGDLDKLDVWFTPYARGAAMTAFVTAVAEAKTTRGASSPVLPLLARFGATGGRLAFDFAIGAKQVRMGLTRKANAYVNLNTHTVPYARAAFIWNTYNHTASRWEDGEQTRDECRVGGPKSMDDIPRWLAAAAKRRKVTWDPATVRVKTTLRGKARAAAVAWLLGG